MSFTHLDKGGLIAVREPIGKSAQSAEKTKISDAQRAAAKSKAKAKVKTKTRAEPKNAVGQEVHTVPSKSSIWTVMTGAVRGMTRIDNPSRSVQDRLSIQRRPTMTFPGTTARGRRRCGGRR